jgi:two-component sensor histidine kinase
MDGLRVGTPVLRLSKIASRWAEALRHGWQGIAQPPPALMVLFAASCLAGSSLARWLVALVRPDTPFVLYVPAAVLVSLVGGVRAGVITALVGGLLGLSLSFDGSPPIQSRISLGVIYLLVAGLIVWGIGHYRSLVIHYRAVCARLSEEERYRRLLTEELQHRLRNKLSTVHAVIRQVLRDQPDAWAKIDSRIRALSATDDLIAQADERGCDLKDLLVSELSPYGEARFGLSGSPVYLPAKLAVCLALVFHELATNAAKYGALSSAAGHLEIDWATADGALTLTWQERGGPVVAPRSKSGFGTKLVNSALAGFDGHSEMHFHPDGLRCILQCRIPPPEPNPPEPKPPMT